MTMSIFPFMNLIGPFKFSSLANRKGIKMKVSEISSGDGTTNVALSEGEKELYVTVVKGFLEPVAN
jgi:hypothetical protein